MPDSSTSFDGVVTTIAAKCRRCYNCVRSCPAKAIRVQSGQAYVLEERCIGCGNCIKVCAQNAKQVQPGTGATACLLADSAPSVALLAPSYPAAYEGTGPGQVVAAVRALGFERVLEVGFGAEMVAAEYARLLRRPPAHTVISTPCPALYSYVCKYMPDLAPSLAPIVSPMVALGRAVKETLAPGAHVVFVGPCIAKKAEIRDPEVAGCVDAVLTFQELDEMLTGAGVHMADLQPESADEPLPHFGALFPISGGLLKAAAIQADVMDDSIVVVEGPERCVAALRDVREGSFTGQFLDALLCEGCIAGPAFSGSQTPLARRTAVTAHVRQLQPAARRLRRALRRVAGTPLGRSFLPQPIGLSAPTEKEIRDILARTNKHSPAQELNCGACGYSTCRDKAIAVWQGLAEPEMCLPYLIDQLQINVERLSRSKSEIEKAREVAMRAQQLASMGQLAADIAQEITTPLSNVVAMAQLVRDSLPADDARREDVATIVAESLHCREVMANLQRFARQREPRWEHVRIAEVVARALNELGPRLAESGVAVDPDVADDLPELLADPEQLTQVLVNLTTNAIEASEREGRVSITAARAPDGDSVNITVADTGKGIEPSLLPRLCRPFVTTKTSGRGAGLGLAVAHGIVQSHHGDMRIESKLGQGTTVVLTLPFRSAPPAGREGVKVLVVDDDPDFLEQHRIILSGVGFDVITAERSDEALEVAAREIPDAFVLDLMMERADSGARLSRAIRRDPRFRSAPIVMLTSVVDETGFEFSRNPREVLDWMKADAWFDKPAPVAELAATIRRLLAQNSGPGTGRTDAPEAGTEEPDANPTD